MGGASFFSCCQFSLPLRSRTQSPTVRIGENVRAENLRIGRIFESFAGEAAETIENHSDGIEILH